MKKYVLLTIILFAVCQLQAQTDMTEKIQEIERQLAEGNLSDEDIFLKYDTLLFYCAQSDIEKLRLHSKRAITYAHETKNEMREARYWRQTAVNFMNIGEMDSVFVFLNRALQIVEGKNWVEESVYYEVMGFYYENLKEQHKALGSFQKSLEIIETDKKEKIANNQNISRHLNSQAHVMNLIASIYYDLHNLEKTAEYLLLSIKTFEEAQHETPSREESVAIRNLGQVYMEMGQSEKSLPLLLRSYEIASGKNDYQMMVYNLQSLSEYYRKYDKNLNNSLKYAKEAFLIAEQTKQPILLTQADNAMMEIHRETKAYQTALYHAERIQERTKEDDWESLTAVYPSLIMIHAALGNIDKTEEVLDKFKALTEKISDKNMHEALQEMEVKYDVRQKEQELSRRQSEIERQKIFRNIYLIGLALALIIIGFTIYIIRLRTRRNQILTEANATKDKFLSIISHDLKNPAIAQRDALQLLTEHADQWDTDSLSQYYSELLKSADGQVELLYSLLNWAQVQTGRMPYLPTQFDLVAALQSDITLIKNIAERKDVTFDMQLPETAVVTGDSNMLTTVVRNLLTNAVKFTAANGTVSLCLKEEPDNQYTITVSDTGTGMSEQQIQDLFRIDRQRSRIGTAGEQGSGLGLIVCKELIEKHGCILHVESEEGKGSLFTFTI